MSTVFARGAFALLLTSTSMAVAQDTMPNACQAQIDDLNVAATAISDEYRTKFAKLSSDASERADQIKDDAPDPGAVGATLKFDIKVTSHDEEFTFGIPVATMRTQHISMDLPEISSHRVEWSWDLPETRMETQCISGPPETIVDPGAAPSCSVSGFPPEVTCSGGRAPSVTIRQGADICTEVPTIRMVTQSASVDVPDVTMRTQDISFDLPEFELVQHKIVLTIPDFTLVNVSASQDKTQNDSAQLEADLKNESGSLTISMQADVKAATSQKVNALFDCNQGQLSASRDATLLKLDTQITDFQRRAQTARDQKNDQLAAGIDGTIASLVQARAVADDQFTGAAAQLETARQTALTKGVNSP